MKKVALIMTDNVLYKNTFVDKLVRNNKDVIKIIIELKFKHPDLDTKKHYQRYFQLLGLKGFIFIGILMVKNIFNKYLISLFSEKGFSLSQIASKNKLAYYRVNDVNSPSTISLLQKHKIDYIINSGNQIYKRDILEVFRARILNRHTSLLPSYGGIYPVFWQLLHGYKKGGITLHWINEKIDEGEVAYSKPMKIDRKLSLFGHYKIAFEISYELCQKAINDMKINNLKYIPLKGEKSYFSWPSKKDIKAFKSKKLKIV